MNNRFKQKRIERNLTQAQLAKEVGVDRSMISKIESGGRCSIDVGLRIARALGTTLDELFGIDEISATSKLPFSPFLYYQKHQRSKLALVLCIHMLTLNNP